MKGTYLTVWGKAKLLGISHRHFDIDSGKLDILTRLM